MIEEPGDRRLASYITDHIGDLGIDVAVYRIGFDAEGGWEIIAVSCSTGESFRIECDTVLDGAVQLSRLIGLDLEE